MPSTKEYLSAKQTKRLYLGNVQVQPILCGLPFLSFVRCLANGALLAMPLVVGDTVIRKKGWLATRLKVKRVRISNCIIQKLQYLRLNRVLDATCAIAIPFDVMLQPDGFVQFCLALILTPVRVE